MSRRPSPNNATPFIPPLSSPNPSPQSHPTSATNTPAPSNQFLYPPTPYSQPYPSSTPAMYHPAFPSAPFATPFQPPIPPTGLSADYAGYPQFLTPTPITQPSQLPSHHPPPNPAPYPSTPWYPPLHPPVSTPWGQPQNLPPSYPPFGAPTHPAYYSTPGMAYAPFSPDPWGINNHARHGWPLHQPPPSQPPPPQHAPRSRTTGFTGDKIDSFLPGTSYGPVLTPFLVGVVNATMKLNPLITPLPDDGGDKPHLKWNMLYTSNYCQRSDDKPHISWSKGREAPATFPRVTSLRIITEFMPWTVEIAAQNLTIGVTCGEVIDGISDCLYHMASGSDYNALPDPRKRAVSESYHHNRSVAADVPGGRLKTGMMRLDFLGKYSMFGGVEINSDVVRRATGAVIPCVFVLRCLKRPLLTESEARTQRERTRSVSRSSNAKTTQSTAEPAASTSSSEQ